MAADQGLSIRLAGPSGFSAAAYLAARYRGHRSLIRDWRYLNELRKRELPDLGLEHA
jgi:hypothetical protein